MTGTSVDVGFVKRTKEVFDVLAAAIKRRVVWDGCELPGAADVADACRLLLGDEEAEVAGGDPVLVAYSDPTSAMERLEREYLREGWRYLGLYAEAALGSTRSYGGESSERARALSAVLSAYITGTCATAAEIEKVSPLAGRLAEFAFLQLESPPSTTTTNALAYAADAKDPAIGGLH